MGMWKRLGRGQEQQPEMRVRDMPRMSSAVHEYRLWRHARLTPLLEKRLGRGVRVKLALIGDPVKRERLREQMLQREYDRLSASARAELEQTVFAGMPRRLRRAVGRKVPQPPPLMRVPRRDAKRSMNVRAARMRGDGPGMTDPHGFWHG